MLPSQRRWPCRRSPSRKEASGGQGIRRLGPMTGPVALPRVYRPLGSRIVAAVAAVSIVAVVVLLWVMLPASSQNDFGPLQRVVIAAFFVLIVVGLYGLFRTRAVANESGLRVINGFRSHFLEWTQMVAISLTPSRAWALIDLDDGTTVSVMALQTADGARATRLVRELADLISHRSGLDTD